MHLAIGLAAVGAVTFLFGRLIPVNASTVGFAFLLVVLGTATSSGFRVATLVSLAATVCFNFFFLPPVGLLTIADPENWVALFTFVLTALVASHLSDRAQKQTAEAKRHQQETEQLYSLSRSILLTDSSRPIGTQAAQSIAQIFNSPLVMILDSKTNQRFQGGPDEMPGLEQRLQDVVRLANQQRVEEKDIDIWPIALGGSPIGALAAAGMRASDGAVQSMLNLVAIALERVRTEEAANRAEASRQSEEFKSTLLDAIAHEFKTPLTSIKAAVTGLRAGAGTPLRLADQQELTAIIEEETDRLSQLVTEAVRMSEIDAGRIKPQRSRVMVSDLLTAAKATFEGRGAERIQTIGMSNAKVLVDPELMVLAIRQVLDNALKYSAPESPVVCEIAEADSESGLLQVRIADQGPGVPIADRERIFEKFYRRAAVRNQVPGSGLGLHIAREIARIHNGDLWVSDPGSQAKGAVFCFSMMVEDLA
jgi:two-component system sensor histidine kinase KdpD